MNTLMASFWVPDALTLRLIAPEWVLVVTIVALLVAPLLVGRSHAIAGGIALLGAAGAAIAALYTFGFVNGGGVELFGVDGGGASAAAGMLATDRLSLFFRVFLMFFLVAIIAMWWSLDAQRQGYAPEFLVLLVCSALGMALMTATLNLVLMVIAIELASMPSYAMTAFDRRRREAAEAAVKYVVFGAATSGFMIYGVSLLYGIFGTLHLPTLVERLALTHLDGALAPLVGFALLALFAGIAFKISAVPFHFWCPDVFQGASLPVATWLSVASKAAGLVLILRMVWLFSQPVSTFLTEDVAPGIAYGVAFFAILTCTAANLMAYRQTNVRRLLAYSSIAHAGYMLCGGAVLFHSPIASESVISAVVAYLLVYLFMNLGAFWALGLVAADNGSEDLDAFTGLGWRDPATAASLTVCLVSLIGLPPLGGFIVKFLLIFALAAAAGAQHSALLWWLIVAVVINTALSLFYYTRVIRQMYLRGVAETGGAVGGPLLGKITLHACAIVLLLTGTLAIPWVKRVADYSADRMYRAREAPPAVAEISLRGAQPSAFDE